MRKTALPFLAMVYAVNTAAQEVVFLPVSYSVDAIYDDKNGIRFSCDQEERLQDELMFYTFGSNSPDTVVLFRSPVYNGYLKGSPEWYNEKGQVIKKIRTYDGGCTVHASSHYFMMPGNIRMYLPALIDYCYTWKTDEPGLKKMQEFYHNGYLEKRIRYYSNGKPRSEEHYVISRRFNWDSYEDFNVEVGGLCIYYYENGKKESEGTRTGYQKTGAWKYYNDEGKLTSEEIHHKKDSVTTITYYPNGQKESIYTGYAYKKTGSQYFFYETGEIKSYTHYDASGSQDTTFITYHKNGRVESITPCCEYSQNGTFYSWHDNGQKHEEVNMVDGHRSGQYTAWHPNGKIKTKGRYEDYGWRSGTWYFYNIDGKPESKRNYEIDPEEPEPVEGIVMYSYEDEPNPLYDPSAIDFKVTVPLVEFTNSKYGLDIPVTKENGLAVIEKYELVLVQIKIDSLGNAAYEIQTPMKEKHLLALEHYFAQYPVFERPFLLMGKPVASTAILQLTFEPID